MLRWTAIAPEHRNGILLGYVVTVVQGSSAGDQDEGGSQELEVEPNLVSLVVEGLVPDTQYNVTISAWTAVGCGPMAHAYVLPRGILWFIVLLKQMFVLRWKGCVNLSTLI